MLTTTLPGYLSNVEREEQLATLGFEVHQSTGQPNQWIFVDDVGLEILVEDLGGGCCKVLGSQRPVPQTS